MIVQTVDICQWRDAFKSIRPDNFSREGLDALFEYMENLSDELGEPVEMDVIAVCVEYSEYENLAEVQDVYDGDEIRSIDDLRAHTTVIEIPGGGLIIRDF